MDLSHAQTVERIRKWSVKYNGGVDPIDFVESIEELAELDVNVNLVPRMMPVLLEDKALMWYRNNNKQWNLWSSFKTDFLKFFLSSRYFKRLEDEVRTRFQKKQESFKDYSLEIKYLMRHTGMNQDLQLERIYRNMRTEYQMYIKRRDFSSLTELAILADDFEELGAEQDKVSRGSVRQEVIVGRIEVEYPQTMVLENTVRRIPTTPIQDKLIPSSNSESPILNQQRSNQQRYQPTAKQVTARIIQDQDIFQNQLYQVSTQQNIQHVMPVKGNLKPFNRNQVTEVQQMLQVQPCEPKQESQNIRPIRGNSQMQETQRQVNLKLTKKNPEVFKPARVTPDQEIFQSQTKQVSVQETSQHITSFKENLKSFNQDQATEFKQMLKIQPCKPQQDSRPNKQNHKVSIQQRVTPNREIVSVEIQELQNQLKSRFIKENLEVCKQQQDTPNHQILQVQTQKVQRQKEPSVIKAQKQKIQRHKDPSPSKKNLQVVNQPKRNLERINLVQVIQDKPPFQIPPPQRLQHVTPTEEYPRVQEAHSQCSQLQEEQLRRPSTELLRTSLPSIPQDQVHSETSLIPRQEIPVKQAKQNQQEIEVIENKTVQHRMTHKTPSPIQESQCVSHQGKDNCTQPKDKVAIPMVQIKEQRLGSWNSSSNRTQQKQMESQGELQQSDHDYINTHQDKFYKVFKSSKKRNRNHSSR
ncbi:probable basic-leucine zipper transcription factor Q [Teleopsis dalmanni]|uniref:probable basic-leucine zipper transcription factor Q n=1 Tax=Teleopsis dalmanni TaxID=139649 RepID=UPI0018CD37F3|nr:probable basic-leucine zipper transcription factor Q [Teleopsis dalmanni]